MKSGTISIATCVVITDAYIQHLSRDPILKKRRGKNINIREQFLAMIHHERPLLLYSVHVVIKWVQFIIKIDTEVAEHRE